MENMKLQQKPMVKHRMERLHMKSQLTETSMEESTEAKSMSTITTLPNKM